MNIRAYSRWIWLFVLLAPAPVVWAENEPELVEEIDAPNEAMPPVTIANGRVFAQQDEMYGEELWLETPRGERLLLRDIVPGAGSSFPDIITRVNDQVLFSAYTEEFGREIWITDGSFDGTFLLKDIQPGPGDSNPHHFIKLDGGVYFLADTGEYPQSVWYSDGLREHTYLFAYDPAASKVAQYYHADTDEESEIIAEPDAQFPGEAYTAERTPYIYEGESETYYVPGPVDNAPTVRYVFADYYDDICVFKPFYRFGISAVYTINRYANSSRYVHHHYVDRRSYAELVGGIRAAARPVFAHRDDTHHRSRSSMGFATLVDPVRQPHETRWERSPYGRADNRGYVQGGYAYGENRRGQIVHEGHVAPRSRNLPTDDDKKFVTRPPRARIYQPGQPAQRRHWTRSEETGTQGRITRRVKDPSHTHAARHANTIAPNRSRAQTPAQIPSAETPSAEIPGAVASYRRPVVSTQRKPNTVDSRSTIHLRAPVSTSRRIVSDQQSARNQNPRRIYGHGVQSNKNHDSGQSRQRKKKED